MLPNIIVVVFDTARADTFEPYGASAGTTPTIAQLARAGRSFPSAFATSNWTLPSHASLFSGRLPRALGLGQSTEPATAIRAHRDEMLASVLSRAGYETLGISANPWISRLHGFDVGFDEFISISGRRHAAEAGWKHRLRWLRDAVRSRADDGMAQIEALLAERLSVRRPDRPFFWFVNLMECHSPYLPPRPYNDLRPWQRLLAGEDARRFQSHRGIIEASLGHQTVPDRSLQRMRHLYERSVTAMDDWLGRVMERLDTAGVLADTAVIVTSDHGENFGEGNLLGHVLSLDDRLVRVPLVLAGPGVDGIGADGPVSIADVPRMVARLAGLADHPWPDQSMPEGVAIAEVDGLRSTSPEIARQIVDNWDLPPEAVEQLNLPITCVTDGRMKLVRYGDRVQLFDLAADQLEQVDVSGHHPGQVRRFTETLDRTAVAGDVSRPEGQGERAPPSPAELAELEERLKLLGYM